MADDGRPITEMLRAAVAGDRAAASDLLPLVYAELRALARARLAGVPPGNTLQPTALVHEAYLKLLGTHDPGWDGRGHFFAAAARAMRELLIDQARAKAAAKRGGGRRRESLDEPNGLPLFDTPVEDVLALDEALTRLEADKPDHARVVMLRFFVGMTNEQIAESQGVSLSTVERSWRYARARLQRDLADPTLGGSDDDRPAA